MSTHTTPTTSTTGIYDGLPQGLIMVLRRLGYSPEETVSLLQMDALMGSTLGHHTVPKIAAYFEALAADMTGETR